MDNVRITGRDILQLGIPQGPLVGAALTTAASLREVPGLDRDAILGRLRRVLTEPATIEPANNAEQALAAALMLHNDRAALASRDTLRDQPLPYEVWGRDLIEPNTLAQMDLAMRLPITLAGALMPDAHLGYGLPVGGVLATRHSVIPYAVGVDIGCAMHMTFYDADVPDLGAITTALTEQTRFGNGNDPDDVPHDAELFFGYVPTLSDRFRRHDREAERVALSQLGSSGSGNHFVETGHHYDAYGRRRFAILSHSGSRALGARIARYYSDLARALHPHLAPEAQHLAWLDLDTEEGKDYMRDMRTAAAYAAANHRLIHYRIAAALGLTPIPHAAILNHHNLATEELINLPGTGELVTAVVHRKGATPAANGTLGIIPGSMLGGTRIVSGRGNPDSLNSASHGAGRTSSRTAARAAFAGDANALRAAAAQRGVRLIGGDTDENPAAYKDPDAVMAAQTDLVTTVGMFEPTVVRMANPQRPQR